MLRKLSKSSANWPTSTWSTPRIRTRRCADAWSATTSWPPRRQKCWASLTTCLNILQRLFPKRDPRRTAASPPAKPCPRSARRREASRQPKFPPFYRPKFNHKFETIWIIQFSPEYTLSKYTMSTFSWLSIINIASLMFKSLYVISCS